MSGDPIAPRSAEEARDPRVFFEAMLPAIIAQHRDAFDAGAGRLCLTVHGVGSWTLTFGDHRADDALVERMDFDADLLLTFSAAGFAALLAGQPLDPQAGQFVYMGDMHLLGLLGRLLVPPARGGIGARLANI